MLIFVLDDGETYTLSEPIPIAVTPEQLTRIEGSEKIYNIFPDWARLNPPCNCVKCTAERRENYLIIKAQNEAKEQ